MLSTESNRLLLAIAQRAKELTDMQMIQLLRLAADFEFTRASKKKLAKEYKGVSRGVLIEIILKAECWSFLKV